MLQSTAEKAASVVCCNIFFLLSVFVDGIMPGTSVRRKNYIIHSTTHGQRIQNEAQNLIATQPLSLSSAKQNAAAPPGQLWALFLLCRGSLSSFWFVLGSFISIANGRVSSSFKAATLTGVTVTGSKLSAVKMKDARRMTPNGGLSGNCSHG